MPASRQTLFFTATWPKSVQRVAGSILRNPIHVHIGNTDQLSANKDVTQVIEVRGWGCGGWTGGRESIANRLMRAVDNWTPVRG